MNTNTVKKEETNAIVVKEAQVIEYVDKANADRENRIVGEIKLITEQTKQVVLMGSIEIGRRLTEAKALVKHGQWGAWLKDRIDYSREELVEMIAEEWDKEHESDVSQEQGYSLSSEQRDMSKAKDALANEGRDMEQMRATDAR